MAVYTDLTPEQIKILLRRFFVGDLHSVVGISEGVENSNFHLRSSSGEYVLTLFETRDEAALDYAQALLLAAREQGLPVAAPLPDSDGRYRTRVAGKPAALAPYLIGDHPASPNLGQIHQIGSFLGQLHKLKLEAVRPGAWLDLNPSAQRTLLQRLEPHLSPAELHLLESALRELEQADLSALPDGPVHGDLFRDNSLFHQGELSGVVDFGAAHHSVLLYDLAIAVTDWCVDGGRLNETGIKALLESYEQHRHLSEQEHEMWPLMMRLAALRFWLSRLRDRHFPRSGSLVRPKDPAEYEEIYRSLGLDS